MTFNRKFHLHDGETGSAITVRITPRMPRNEISEIMEDGTIKIRLTAAPVDGKANQALIEYLSNVFDISSSKIEIIAGQTNRNKLVSILDVDADELNRCILRQIANQTK
jgi:uncharacterized protein